MEQDELNDLDEDVNVVIEDEIIEEENSEL